MSFVVLDFLAELLFGGFDVFADFALGCFV